MELGKTTYLDNAAAFPVKEDILNLFKEYSEKYFANPEAVHFAGRKASLAIKDAAQTILDVLTGKEGEYSLSWASSATEAINIALSYPGFKGKAIVSTKAEHSAMKSVIEKGGFCELRKVEITNDGLLDLNDFEKKMDAAVGVVSIHHVQNETGALQDLSAIREIINKKAPEAVFIVDTVQSIGKIPVPWKQAKINIAFIGGHKIGAPSGASIIYDLSKNIKNEFEKYLYDIRSATHSIGRPDTSICITLADAVSKAASMNVFDKILSLNQFFRKKMLELKTEMNLNILLPVPEKYSSPYIATFIIPPYQGEVLVRMLSDKGVMVSSGSACAASKEGPSSTLLAMGISAKDARTAIRVSFSFESEKEDVERFIATLREVLNDY